ncbi:MAG: class I SAM-dependent methyltransferase [Verrucomicrobiaceae bacterium]|nr:MAG: class I SAM-dependent methyltransferase [Verrucomicrobiaceae bacterium]
MQNGYHDRLLHKRAAEYERIYQKPERQPDLLLVADYLKNELSGRHALEVACGTGYWTEIAANAATRIVATDINEEVLTIARAKRLSPEVVTFENRDAYRPDIQGKFDAGFACFWWSHVPLERLHQFLMDFHASLEPGSSVTFVDNRFVPGSSTAISESDDDGNTYQSRRLLDGTTHRLLKNFPSPVFLRDTLGAYSDDVLVTEFEYFWCVTYALNKTTGGKKPA